MKCGLAADTHVVRYPTRIVCTRWRDSVQPRDFTVLLRRDLGTVLYRGLEGHQDTRQPKNGLSKPLISDLHSPQRSRPVSFRFRESQLLKCRRRFRLLDHAFSCQDRYPLLPLLWDDSSRCWYI
jgi:hypothetical protein